MRKGDTVTAIFFGVFLAVTALAVVLFVLGVCYMLAHPELLT